MRRQLEDGAWRYRVGIAMWQTTTAAGVAAAEYLVWVTPEQVRPIDGIDYSTVATERPVVEVPEPAGARWGWRVRRMSGGRTVVHVHDCPESGGGSEVSLDEALTELRRARASACKTCEAAEALTPLV
ncbi:DUF6233 domain-containing protein [Streptomyces scopuliridis]|uniref:DUF6233 domain-containing protein n=1 Tax=Streptomyces scopuliridis TaxID=452529 RepID=UPI00342DE8F6